MANEENLVPFKKNDPRINRKGRPKSFDALRALAQEIAIEPAKNQDGHQVVINDKIATKIEVALRVMLTDKKLFATFLEYAYGKPKVELEHSGEIKTGKLDVSQLTDDELKTLSELVTRFGNSETGTEAA